MTCDRENVAKPVPNGGDGSARSALAALAVKIEKETILLLRQD